jgi:hypothetical protein
LRAAVPALQQRVRQVRSTLLEKWRAQQAMHALRRTRALLSLLR